MLWSANTGDCRALLFRVKDSVALSNNHRCENESEVLRVEETGGFIRNLRAQNILESFRTIGDLDCDSNIIICSPEMIQVQLGPQDSFLLIGTDGVFQKLSNTEVVHFVKQHIDSGTSIHATAQLLAKHCAEQPRSHDNVTLTLIRLS